MSEPKKVPTEAEVEAFVREIDEVCKRHGMGISHEDGHGSFIIVRYENSSFAPDMVDFEDPFEKQLAAQAYWKSLK